MKTESLESQLWPSSTTGETPGKKTPPFMYVLELGFAINI